MVTVAGRSGFPEMPILCLDDLVRVVTVTCVRSHGPPSCLHVIAFIWITFLVGSSGTRPARTDHTEASAAEASSILIDRRLSLWRQLVGAPLRSGP